MGSTSIHTGPAGHPGRFTRLLAAVLIIGTLAQTTAAVTNIVWERVYDATVDGQYMAGAFSGGMSFAHPEFADIDTDGDLDLFVGNQQGAIWFFRNVGTPQNAVWLSPDQNYGGILADEGSAPFGPGGFSAPSFGDLDGDGDLDLLLGEQSGRIKQFTNTGSPESAAWSAPVDLMVAPTQGLPPATIDSNTLMFPTLADTDADGDLDLLIGTGLNEIYYCINTGDVSQAAFAIERTLKGFLLGAPIALDMTLGDLDGDGDLDSIESEALAQGEFLPRVPERFENIGGATNLELVAVSRDNRVIRSAVGGGAVALADIDADGDQDLFFGGANGQLQFFRNRGAATNAAFSLAANNYVWLDFGSRATPTALDGDLDGDTDLLVGRQDGVVAAIKNIGTAGTPTWELGITNIVGEEALPLRGFMARPFSSPAACDIDDDGDLDYFAGTSNGHIDVAGNAGSPESPVVEPPELFYALIDVGEENQPVFVDIDDDGDQDLVIGTAAGTLTFHENTGTAQAASFTAPLPGYAAVNVAEGSTPAFADLDQDGDPDLFVGAANGTLSFVENTGTAAAAAWAPAMSNFAGVDVGTHSRPTFLDPDGDDDLDLLVGDGLGGLHLWKNSSPRLSISPPSTTVASGESVPFALLNTTNPAAWSFVVNQSGGTLDTLTGVYVAGTATSGIVRTWNNGPEPITDSGWVTTIVDEEGRVGEDPSIALGPDGHPRIAYEDVDSQDIKYATFDGSNWAIEVIGLENVTSPSLAIGTNGIPQLAVTELSETRVLYVTKTNGTWSGTVVDTNRGTRNPSIALGPNDEPRISYYDGRTGVFSLRYAEWNGSNWVTELVRTNGGVANALAIDTNGTAHLGFTQFNFGGNLEVAVRSGATWTSDVVSTSIRDVSIDLTEGGRPHLSYFLRVLDDLYYTFPAGAGWNYVAVDTADTLLGDSSLVLDSSGLAHVAYGDGITPDISYPVPSSFDTTLRYGAYNGATFVTHDLLALGAGNTPSMVLDADDKPIIAHFDSRRTALAVTRKATGASSVSTLYVPDDVEISDVQVGIAISHGNRGQLLVVLESPEGTSVALHSASGAGSPDLVKFYGTNGNPIDGPGSLSDFIGENMKGEWKLSVLDISPGTIGALFQWELVFNGGKPAVDTIEATTADGVRGRAYVNVIRPEEAAAAGKAIIVAGGKSLDDPVWDATDLIAQKAYRTLLHRGFLKDNIHYLSFETGKDVDGNGSLDDMDGEALLANVENTFTNWAAGASKLFVYLADHGSDSGGSGFFRLNSGENLTASQLDGWLDDLQDNNGMDVTVIMDFCYSGSFLDELTYPGPAERVVMASTEKTNLTYFIAGGLVSFSDLFFSSLFQGSSFEEAFLQARNGMFAHQQAQLDDNRSGVYEPDLDGPLADTFTLGANFTVGRDIPQVGTITPNRQLNDVVPVTLYAGDVTSTYPIERVWTTIIPPSHAPNATSGIPVVDLPEVDLFLNPANNRYEGSFNQFTEPGTYALIFSAQDIWGGVSFPKQSYITQAGFDERVILVAGGPTNSTEWPALGNMADFAYETCLARKLDTNSIHYLSPVMHTGVDATSSVATLRDAITNWAANADRLTLYVVAPETNGLMQLSESESVQPTNLASWLDAFQVSSNQEVNVVLDFKGAGSYLSYLPSTSGAERVLMASTKPGRDAIRQADGLLSFSSLFMGRVFEGNTIGDAFTEARRSIRRTSGRARQTPQVDDSGDGTASKTDGTLAETRYLGAAFVTGEDTPFIGEVMPDLVVSSTGPVTLWAADIEDVDGITNVQAIITPPLYDGVSPLTETNLAMVATNSRYEAVLTNLTKTGVYDITFVADDEKSNRSSPRQARVENYTPPAPLSGGGGSPDAYEDDDTFVQAQPFQVAFAQAHNFHDQPDEDWVMFYATDGLAYEIEAEQLGTNSDLAIEVYYEQTNGVLTNLTYLAVDDEPKGLGFTEFTAVDFPFDPLLESGLYYVRVYNADTNCFGEGSDYELNIFVSAGAEILIVCAFDEINARPLGQGTVNLYNSVPSLVGTTNFLGEDCVEFTGLDTGWHAVEVVPPAGYFPTESPVTVGETEMISSTNYGNPRLSRIEETDSYRFMYFSFFPWARFSPEAIRDGVTGEYLDDVKIEWVPRAGVYATRFVVHTQYPNRAVYANPWTSSAGQFPLTNFYLPAVKGDLALSKPGYVYQYTSNVIGGGVTPGFDVASATIFMSPIDANANGIRDTWEDDFYGPGSNVVASEDTDMDTHTALDEYYLGTDPHSEFSGLFVEEAGPTNSTYLKWPVVAGRVYRVTAAGDVKNPESWDQVAGPWTAVVGQTHMEWTGSGPSLSNEVYRVELLVR